ncbi:MAG: hypothetical protein ACRCW6_01050, partial [Mycoplasmoidaceae bacterium]
MSENQKFIYFSYKEDEKSASYQLKQDLAHQQASEFENITINYNNNNLKDWILDNNINIKETISKMVYYSSINGKCIVIFLKIDDKVSFEIIDIITQLRHTGNRVFVASGTSSSLILPNGVSFWNIKPNTIYNFNLKPSSTNE